MYVCTSCQWVAKISHKMNSSIRPTSSHTLNTSNIGASLSMRALSYFLTPYTFCTCYKKSHFAKRLSDVSTKRCTNPNIAKCFHFQAMRGILTLTIVTSPCSKLGLISTCLQSSDLFVYPFRKCRSICAADYALMLHQQQGWQWQYDKSLRPRTENTCGQNADQATAKTEE